MTIVDVLIRLVLAVVVGGLIGYEREFKSRPAGFRTHILVCVGAAVTSMIQLYSVQEAINLILKHPELANTLKADIGRLGAQVITGVGFLGAGTIIHEKGAVKGLTTAASIWVVACIGLAAGLGYYGLTIAATLCVFGVLVILKKFEVRFIERAKTVKLQIRYNNYEEGIQQVAQYLSQKNVKIRNIEFCWSDDTEASNEYSFSTYTLYVPKVIRVESLIHDLSSLQHVAEVNKE